MADFGPRPLRESSVFEIGYGAVPKLLFALAGYCYEAHGIDLDAPVVARTPSEYLNILRTNGFERLLKTAARSLLFDKQELQILDGMMQELGAGLEVDRSICIVGDASSPEMRRRLPPSSVDVVVSEDVFEHIPADRLPAVVSLMAHVMRDDALAFVRPNVWTGITGGHDPAWYYGDDFLTRTRRSEPWAHLKTGRVTANTFLNRLRLDEYRTIFLEEFNIIAEIPKHPRLGQEWLNAEIRGQLAGYTEEELLANQTMFVLRKATTS